MILHPEKTRRVDFRYRYRKENIRCGKPVNFDFLGFTHFWGKSRKGNYVVYQKTAKGRLAKTLKSFNDYCRRNRHKPLDCDLKVDELYYRFSWKSWFSQTCDQRAGASRVPALISVQ